MESKAIFPFVIVALLSALWAGLVRMGWLLPVWQPTLAAQHGALMVSGFLGALIGLERAVALNRRWCYFAPFLTGLGALFLALGVANPVGPILMLLGSGLLLIVSIVIVQYENAWHTITMGAGTMALFIANLLWVFGWPVYRISYWWGGFLLLVIAGERLELNRILRPTVRIKRLFVTAVSLFILGLSLSLLSYPVGMRIASLGVIAIALWLGRYDIARRTIRKPGVTRFIAWNLLMGYGWLIISGLIGLYFGELVAGPFYDAWLHTLFLGFTFSMIFAHALIILPAITGISIKYHPIFYAPPVFMHISLLIRIVGDLALLNSVRQWGGLLNVFAILGFMALIIYGIVQQRR